MKIGDHELTSKDLAVAGIFVLVVIALLWVMVGAKPNPTVLQKGMADPVLLQGGIPGAGKGQFSYPRGIAVDSNGDIYVADSRNHRIQKIKGADGKFTLQFGKFFNVGGGDKKKLENDQLGMLNEPNDVAIGPDDMVYVMDTWNGRVQIFTPKGKAKRAIASDDGVFAPRGIVVDPNGFIYIADTGKHRIVKFDPKGQKIKSWGMKGDKNGEFNEPIGVALDQAGNLYVADRLNFRIQVFSGDGQYIREWPVKGWSKEQIDMEPHLAIDQAHSLLYASDGRGHKVYCFKLDGSLVSTIENDAQGRPLFSVPIGVAVDKQGALYVVDAGAGKIFKIRGQF
ncbi:MAG TPA: NHL repeat-containing protein [bacterium]|nr:NHL repeat-containing protein [bacterium]